MKDMKGRVAVVTGGGSGIGRGMVRAFAAEGVKVVVADIELSRAEEVAKEVDGIPVHVDVTDFDSVQALADTVYDRLGRVDILCNNAGVGLLGKVIDTKIDDWRWIISANVFGPIHGVCAFLPRMVEAPGDKHIVNTGSVAGLVPLEGIPAYSTSKYAVVGLSEAMRPELAEHNIGVTVLCAGSVRTRMSESSRIANSGGQMGARPDLRQVSLSEAVDPDELGKEVCAAVIANEPYVLSFSTAANNLKMPGMIRDRFAAIESRLPR